MKNMRKLLATATLVGIIIIGITPVKAGVIFNIKNDNQRQQCTKIVEKKETRVDKGVIFNLTGVIFNLTGVIFNLGEESPTECGFIMTD